MRRILILSLLFSFSNPWSASADLRPLADVIPVHGFGSVRIVAPDMPVSINGGYRLTLNLEGGSQIQIGELNKSFLVSEQINAGFCLAIEPMHPTLRGGRFCGFILNRGESLLIELKTFRITAKDTYSVNIGPLMAGYLSAKPTGSRVWSDIPSGISLQHFDFSLTYIAPTGSIGFSTDCPNLVVGNCVSQKEFLLDASNKSPVIYDVTPPDFRKSISLKVWELPRMKTPTGTTSVLLGFRQTKNGIYPFPESVDISVERIARPPQIEWINAGSIMSRGISFDKPEQNFTLFPVDSKDAVYTLDINGYSYPFTGKQRLEIEPLNVEHLTPGPIAGFFTLDRRSKFHSDN